MVTLLSGPATVELGSDSFRFERAQCDLTDAVDDDILARGSTTTPDGRRVSFEVERREVRGTFHDRVTVYFGSLAQGDQWHTRGVGQPGGPWTTAVAGGRPLAGPLVVIGKAGLTARGTFEHETRDESRPGSLQVNCGA
jgi:hypothetical protein